MAGIGLNRSRQAPAEDTPSFGAIAERFRRAGDLDRAIALCQEGLKKFPNQLSARVTLGWAFLDKGEYDLARQELERVIRRAPDNLAAIRGLAELHDRAEHAVSGLGPDGMWVPADETPDEPAAAAVPAAPLPAAAIEPEPFEAAPPAPPAPAAVPVPVIVSASDHINPLSLIETPAQAAVAHAGQGDVEPAVSVFEQVIERASDAVLAASAQPAVVDAADWSEPAVTIAETPLALQEIADEWESASPTTASEPATDAVLLAENAEVELDRVASEFDVAESDPVVSDVIIDLPDAVDVLASELEQFEVTQPVESEATGDFDAATLDSVLSTSGMDAAEQLEALDTVFSAATNAPEPELVLHLEEGHFLEADAATDVESAREEELQDVAEFEVEPASVSAAPDAPIAAEDVTQDTVPEEWQLASPAAAFEAAEPEGFSVLGVGTAPEPLPVVVDANAEADLEAEADDVEPRAAVGEPAPNVAEPSVEIAAEPVGQRAEPVEVSAEPAVEAAEPVVEVSAEPAADVVEPVEIASLVTPVVEAATETAEADEAAVEVVAAADEIAEPLADAAEPDEVPESVEVATTATDADQVEEVDDIGADADESSGWAMPDLAWMPPSGDAVGAPAMASSAAHMNDEAMDLLFPPPVPPAPASAAPIARLEAFLHKVTARRLHLSPDSVA